MIIERLFATVDNRLKVASPLRKALRKIFPDHWTFMFGEVALYAFVVLVLTGVFLALFFDPSSAETTYHGDYLPMQGQTSSAAYASALQLSFDVRAGLLMRQTHHWAALVFIGAIVVHVCRIFFTGAFRRPREINWVIGVTMLLLALVNGFTGYSMPDDQLSGIGVRIIYSVVQSVPVVGSYLVFLIFGGEFPADATIPRMFTAHVFVVPALLAVLIGAHLIILVRQKHSQFAGRGRTEHNVVGSRLWPSYTVRTLGLFAAVLAVLFTLGGLAQINPIWIYGPFDPIQGTTPSQPDWYVAWGEGALRIFPSAEFHVFGHLVPTTFFPGVALGGIAFVALYAYPFLEAWRTHDDVNHQLLDRPRDHPVRMAIGVWALAFFGLLVGAASDDVLARWWDIPLTDVVWAFRILVLTVPWLAAAVAFVLARALQSTEGGLAELTRKELRTAFGKHRDSPPAAEPPSGRLRVEPTDDNRWNWRYIEDGDSGEFSLQSNEDYDTEQAAVSAARAAYAGLDVPAPVLDGGGVRPTRNGHHRSSTGTGALTVATGLVVATWLIRSRNKNKT